MKAQTVSLFYQYPEDGQIYLLNLIDTPGHVDFANEVSEEINHITNGPHSRTSAAYRTLTRNRRLITSNQAYSLQEHTSHDSGSISLLPLTHIPIFRLKIALSSMGRSVPGILAPILGSRKRCGMYHPPNSCVCR